MLSNDSFTLPYLTGFACTCREKLLELQIILLTQENVYLSLRNKCIGKSSYNKSMKTVKNWPFEMFCLCISLLSKDSIEFREVYSQKARLVSEAITIYFYWFILSPKKKPPYGSYELSCTGWVILIFAHMQCSLWTHTIK